MVARGVGYGPFIDEPMSSGKPRRATVKAHTTSTQPPSPLVSLLVEKISYTRTEETRSQAALNLSSPPSDKLVR